MDVKIFRVTPIYCIILFIAIISGCDHKKQTTEPTPPQTNTEITTHLRLLGQNESIMVLPGQTISDQQALIDDTLPSDTKNQRSHDNINTNFIIHSYREKILHSIIKTVDTMAIRDPDAINDNLGKAYVEQENTGSTMTSGLLRGKMARIKDRTRDFFHTRLHNLANKASSNDVKTKVISPTDSNKVLETHYNPVKSYHFLHKRDFRIRFWSFMEKIRKIVVHRGIYSLIPNKGTDSGYFSHAIVEARLNPDIPIFNVMQPIVLTDSVKNMMANKGINIESVTVQLKRYDERVTLGRLPTRGTVEDARENTVIRNTIKSMMLANTTINDYDTFIAELDSFKNTLIQTKLKHLQNLDTYPEYHRLQKQSGNKALLDSAIDFARIRETKQLASLMVARNYSMQSHYAVLEDIGYLRQLFRYFDNDQIAAFKQGQTIALNDKQTVLAEINGGITRLYQTYQALTSVAGEATINTLTAPRDINMDDIDTPVYMASIVEQFELASFLPELLASKYTANMHHLPQKRYLLTIADDDTAKSLGTDHLEIAQFSTRDREMLTPEILNVAIDELRTTLLTTDKMIYIHCKSGVGRSASVITGSRTDRIIELINEQGYQLTRREIDKLLDSQINQIQAARPITRISPPQKANLLFTLFNRQKQRLLKPTY